MASGGRGEESAQVECPECGDKVHLSHRRGVFDRVQSFFGRRPFRCLTCRYRFYAKKPEGNSHIAQPMVQDAVDVRRDERL